MDATIAQSLYSEELYRIPGKVVIVLSKPWNEILPDEKTQLSKILAALKLRLESVQIVQCKSLEALLPLSPSKVISFGPLLKSDATYYEATAHEGISLIHADALNQLDDAKKKTLWIALKAMFGI